MNDERKKLSRQEIDDAVQREFDELPPLPKPMSLDEERRLTKARKAREDAARAKRGVAWKKIKRAWSRQVIFLPVWFIIFMFALAYFCKEFPFFACIKQSALSIIPSSDPSLSRDNDVSKRSERAP